MSDQKKKLQYVTLMWEELPEAIKIFVIPRSDIKKEDIKMLRACHGNYINAVGVDTTRASKEEVDHSLVRLYTMIRDPESEYIQRADDRLREAEGANMELDEFEALLGVWHHLEIETESPCALPRSKFYRTGLLM